MTAWLRPRLRNRAGRLGNVRLNNVVAACCGALLMVLLLAWQAAMSAGPSQPAMPRTTISPPTVPATPLENCGGNDAQLVVATGDDVSTGSVRREVIEEWNDRLKPPADPRSKLLELSGSTDVRRAQMAALAQAGSCAYDILVLDVAWVTEFARHGYIQPIDLDDRDNRFLTGPLEAGQIDGEQYGVPFAADAPLEFRRLDRRSGGYLLQLDDNEMGTVNFLETIELGGGKVLDGDDRTAIVLGHARDDVWRALTSPTRTLSGTEESAVVLRESLQMDEDASVVAFKESEAGGQPVAYMRNWPIAFHQLASDPRMRDSGRKLRFDVHAPAAHGGVLGGSVLAVSRHIKPAKLAPAMRLINRLTSPEVQATLFACGGYSPVLSEVYERYEGGGGPSCRRQDGSDITNPSLDELSRLATETKESIERARPRPKSPYYAQFSELFRRCARGVWENKVSRETFFASAGALEGALNGRVQDDRPLCGKDGM
ncbi:extracellular solute-binding protein [Nonomuraea longispora]|uniref:Extracellular solute-binding protein n=1 Tax=Nonomuraea longispora TaxID=1848320 RepID=A0A4R4NRF3_9ACTN|nr:extracellular solute-binding protein [Nonomuraea longispora]TDC10523.1 extracellular solute-binding protein [Nonomuraea longispora]